ncbi:MAG: hypothetical protein RIE77_14475 [Phycisphaerales bacterium]|jgi:hypothetical protein
MPRTNRDRANEPDNFDAEFENAELNDDESASLDEAIGPLADADSISGDDAPPPPEPRRAEVVDRRLGLDRRNMPGAAAPTGLERRRGRGRRLSDFHRSAEEGEMTQEQFMFLMAIDAFKKGNDVTFPAWSDVLEIIRLLGYRKVQKAAVDLGRAEDWTEPPEASHNVRTDKQLQRHAAARAAFKKGDSAA